MKKLVFICHGNTFRSPIAEAVFNKDPKDGWRAYSCGTLIKEENIEGESILDVWPGEIFIVNEMKKRGMDISLKHTARLYPEYLEDADKVIIMSEEDLTPDWLLDRAYERWDILNPENPNDDLIIDIINKITEKVNELKTRLK